MLRLIHWKHRLFHLWLAFSSSLYTWNRPKNSAKSQKPLSLYLSNFGRIGCVHAKVLCYRIISQDLKNVTFEHLIRKCSNCLYGSLLSGIHGYIVQAFKFTALFIMNQGNTFFCWDFVRSHKAVNERKQTRPPIPQRPQYNFISNDKVSSPPCCVGTPVKSRLAILI